MSCSNADKLPLCQGCRDNYYNTQGKANGQSPNGCFSLSKAKRVTRFRLGWWTRPDSPGAFRKVETLSCHRAPGQYAHYEKLPDFVTKEERKRIEGD